MRASSGQSRPSQPFILAANPTYRALCLLSDYAGVPIARLVALSETNASVRDTVRTVAIGLAAESAGKSRELEAVARKHLDTRSEASDPAAPTSRAPSRPANIREFEAAARERLGLSAREAKRLAAGGWAALARDEPDAEANATERELEALLDRVINRQIRNSSWT